LLSGIGRVSVSGFCFNYDQPNILEADDQIQSPLLPGVSVLHRRLTLYFRSRQVVEIAQRFFWK
jgi:hypothetical protein